VVYACCGEDANETTVEPDTVLSLYETTVLYKADKPPGLENSMALEDVHLDVLQNIEFAIVSVYRKQPNLRDVEVMRALDALIDVYRAEERGHAPKDVSLPGVEGMIFERTREMCELRLGRQAVAVRVDVPFEGDKTVHDIVACLRKIRRSAERWNKRNGQQGYLQFVREFVK
jgi:hypothetical protein